MLIGLQGILCIHHGAIDISDQIYRKGSYACSFKAHFSSLMIATSIDQRYIYVIQQNVKHSPFIQVSFPSLFGAHDSSGGLEMAPSPLDWESAGYNPPYDCLMSLAMDKAALCDMWR